MTVAVVGIEEVREVVPPRGDCGREGREGVLGRECGGDGTGCTEGLAKTVRFAGAAAPPFG